MIHEYLYIEICPFEATASLGNRLVYIDSNENGPSTTTKGILGRCQKSRPDKAIAPLWLIKVRGTKSRGGGAIEIPSSIICISELAPLQLHNAATIQSIGIFRQSHIGLNFFWANSGELSQLVAPGIFSKP